MQSPLGTSGERGARHQGSAAPCPTWCQQSSTVTCPSPVELRRCGDIARLLGCAGVRVLPPYRPWLMQRHGSEPQERQTEPAQSVLLNSL